MIIFKERKTIIISVSILICTIIFAVDSAYAQEYIGNLTLDPIPDVAKDGSIITISGQFRTTEGYPVRNATIYIKDDVTLDTDTILKKVTTNDDGRFHTTWTATVRSSGAWDIYAIFEGNDEIYKSRSPNQSIRVSSSYSGEEIDVPNVYPTPRIPTTITLDKIPSSIYAGKSVTFTGELVSNGKPLSNAMVMIYEDDIGDDERLGYQKTDSNGRFSIVWKVDAALFEKDFDIYAVFDGDSIYKRDRSTNQIMTVLKYSGGITLDSIPSSAKVGERVTFSGTLRLEKSDPEGMAVYIKDEDPASEDDLLATAYVDGNGRFSADWIAYYADADNTVDIYAVFEGNDILYRQTTCDSGPTLDIGGSCKDTIPLTIYGAIQTSPPPSYQSDNEYMELYYSIPFNRAPHIAIVPNPDSYDKVRGHITPVKEGILMWESEMEQKYDGRWDVTFEVLTPGKLRFDSKPDVIVNLDTYEDHSGCKDYYGFAYIRTPIELPVQTHVCSTYHGERRSNTDVEATAAHEFIHAVGLGHTFNKYGDLMCSEENNIPTCGGLWSKSKTPSSLNLAAVARIYGNDGFRGPNNYVQYGEKFVEGDSNQNTNRDYTDDDFVYKPTPPTIPPVTPPVIPPITLPPIPPATPPAIPPTIANECIYDDYVYDETISESLWSGWYVSYKICSDDQILYYFESNSEYDGFEIYILPPETNVREFMNYGEGSYYLCEEYRMSWTNRVNWCNIDSGSNIVLYNPGQDTIELTGYIKSLGI